MPSASHYWQDDDPGPWADDPINLSQPSHLSQPVTTVTNVTPCNSLSQPRHSVSQSPGFINLSDVGEYLAKGGAPTHLKHKIIELLAIQLAGSDEIESAKRNLRDEIMNIISVTSGDISVTDCYTALQVVTKTEKATVRQILHRLTQEKVLNKQGSRAGMYRIVDNDLEVLDWRNASGDEFPVNLPLEIGEYVKIMPKNLVVVAGSPNSGKTAFLLNILRSNMYNYNINYFSSEMSECEMHDRLSKFSDVPINKWRFSAYNRSSNFADVIVPDEINIIDFLELHDEFWKVGSMFKEIYEKLTTGIAIIAIQKKSGAKVGKGGEITLEKPRLYLSMENGKIKIEKGKNWRIPGVNPNNLACTFKLVQGSKFIKEGDWIHENN